ncbi:estradiol 17-beta-dehydrogenase 11-like [Malaya genurostris]|uniref:estradiol 17-beta-dehydrogenase 11-like n=1 Tax=Malaya genurostris TaxID=325434 RepID=UPI0026F3AB0F|nr:estradiol 17-beta-dehydrogenase 11-like [Malaya genurostris]
MTIHSVRQFVAAREIKPKYNGNMPTSMSSSLDILARPYIPADPLQSPRLAQRISMLLQMLLDLLIIFACSIPLWIELVVEIFSPPPPKNISGQTALVTGGANGIGKAIATELAKEGCNVIIVDLDQTNGEKTALELRRYNVTTVAYKFDVAEYEQVRQLYRVVERDFGPVDILVNNAGILPFLSSEENHPSGIKRMMDVNVLAGFWTVEQFLPNMVRRRKGHIVAIASASAYTPVGWMRTYVTSKYAVRGYMEALDEELYLKGQSSYVKTTTVFPFIINTRKQLMERMGHTSGVSSLPKFSPEQTARTVVKAIRTNKRKVVVPESLKAWQLNLYEHIPIKIRRMMDLTVMKGRPIVLD